MIFLVKKAFEASRGDRHKAFRAGTEVSSEELTQHLPPDSLQTRIENGYLAIHRTDDTPLTVEGADAAAQELIKTARTKVEETIGAAQQQAIAIITEARNTADEMLTEAGQEGAKVKAQILKGAREEADRLVGQAGAQAKGRSLPEGHVSVPRGLVAVLTVKQLKAFAVETLGVELAATDKDDLIVEFLKAATPE